MPVADPAPTTANAGARVRLSIFCALAVMALGVLGQGLNMLRLEDERAVDARILEKASLHRTFAQQAGRMAALISLTRDDTAERVRHADALGLLIVESGNDAVVLDALLQQAASRSAAARQRLQPLLQSWERLQAARERLWYRTELLLRQADDGSADDIARDAAALQNEIAPSMQSAQAFAEALGSAWALRSETMRREVQWGGWLLLGLLALLGVAVVEPTARSVQRHARRLAEQATELQRLALVAEHTSALVIVSDDQHRVLWANRAFQCGTGWTLDEVRGRRPPDFMPDPLADPAALQRVRQALRDGRGVREELLNRTKDGRELWLDLDLRPLHGPRGQLTGFISVSTDTTARVRQRGKLQALWAVLPAGVLVQSRSGRVVEINRAAERLLGRSLAQLQDVGEAEDPLQALRDDGSAYPPGQYPSMRTLASGRPLVDETMGVRLPCGGVRWLVVNTEPQLDSLGHVTGVVSCLTDITERRQLQDRLSDNARTDALTQLPNRLVVAERLQQALDHARRHAGYGFAVLFMDFDRFKHVNDTLGHAAGDDLLRQIAGRLAQALRPGDALARLQGEPGGGAGTAPVAARLGGDEFVVVLEGVNDAATVGVIAERLLLELAEPYLIGASPVQSSASIGVVVCSGTTGGGTLTAEEVLRNADTAMYEAKRGGRNRWVLFDDSMHERVMRTLAMESDLRRALKDGELFVVYQPVVDLDGGAMRGVEALVRWRHPARGLVSPVEFIGVAEECGLIDAVGSVVLLEACTQFMRWQTTLGRHAPKSLAVNLSRAQLQRAGLVDEVASVLQQTAMPPALLQLEVTESLAAQDERVQTTLGELKGLGVRLALDDFGTGYSSLACLHQMPVDTVKVDRSFVQHAETVEYHRVLIEATIRVARTLGMTTVAEGIETPGQARLMRHLHCDRGQGYLYSRPLEAAELAGWALDRAVMQAPRPPPAAPPPPQLLKA